MATLIIPFETTAAAITNRSIDLVETLRVNNPDAYRDLVAAIDRGAFGTRATVGGVLFALVDDLRSRGDDETGRTSDIGFETSLREKAKATLTIKANRTLPNFTLVHPKGNVNEDLPEEAAPEADESFDVSPLSRSFGTDHMKATIEEGVVTIRTSANESALAVYPARLRELRDLVAFLIRETNS